MADDNNAAHLYCGDCLEILPTLKAGDAHLVIADPPYLLGSASMRRGTRPQSPLGMWANASHWYQDWICECFRITGPAGAIWMFGNWRTLPVLEIAVQALARRITSILVWDKEWIGVGTLKGLRCQYELIFLIGGSEFAIPDRSIGNIWQEKWASARPTGHTSEKPVNLMRRMIDVSALALELTVLDPFMGSGTTGVACVNTGHNFIGIEIDPNYFALAEKRIGKARAQLTLGL